jgi:hypothetical protein
MCLHLQKRGHEIVGIDNSPLAIRVCIERGVEDVRLMSITQLSSRLGRFDTILMMCNNFGLLGGMERAKWILKRLKGLTTRDAKIIGASTDPYRTENPHHLRYHDLNRRRGRMPGQVRIRIRYQTYASEWFDYLLASREEMGRSSKARDGGWTGSSRAPGHSTWESSAGSNRPLIPAPSPDAGVFRKDELWVSSWKH